MARMPASLACGVLGNGLSPISSSTTILAPRLQRPGDGQHREGGLRGEVAGQAAEAGHEVLGSGSLTAR
jgi:hypothetical protein